MHRKLAPLWVGCSLCALLLLSTPLVSCSSSWRSTSYKTAGTTIITADTAMKAWAIYVANGKANPEQEQKVREAYDKYRASMSVVVDVGKASTTSTNLAMLDVVVITANIAQSNLVAVIAAFTK